MTKVKICGITNLEDARVAVEAGADLLGFIFYEPSPRYVSPEIVREIVAGLQVAGRGAEELERKGATQATNDQPGPLFVGVFVNSPLETVQNILDFCRLDAAQLHGEELPEFVNAFNGRAYKAIRPQSLTEAEGLIQTYQPTHPRTPAPPLPRVLLDAYHPTLYGGTGRATDWTLAAAVARRYPIMLAGSLTVENVAEAVRAVQPWGVDVSSGVEAVKGKKDHEKVRRFVEVVKNIARGA